MKIYPRERKIHVSRYIAALGVVAEDIAMQGKAVVTVALGGGHSRS